MSEEQTVRHRRGGRRAVEDDRREPALAEEVSEATLSRRPRRARPGARRPTSRSRSAPRPTSRTTASASRATPPSRSSAASAASRASCCRRSTPSSARSRPTGRRRRAARSTGLRLVQRELPGALERVGIESFGAAGERFDPELHEAVAQQPRDGVPAGEITEVYQAGYRLAAGRSCGPPACSSRAEERADGRPQGPLRRPRRRPQGHCRGDQEGLPQARAPATTPTATPTTRTAEERFKEISEAHDLLSDPEKRAAYDRGESGIFGGAAGAANPFGGGGFDGGAFGDILSNLFGGAAAAARRAPPGPGARPRPRGADPDQLRPGGRRRAGAADVPLTERCATCNGTGARPGTTPTVCPRCEGRGIESQGQGMFSITQPCSRCGGSGTVIESPCPTCNGTGATRGVKRLRVNIPAGVHDGSRIRLAGKGEAGLRGGPPGDLYVITHVTPSPVFTQKGAHLEVEVPLHDRRGAARRRGRGADAERRARRCASRPGTAHGTVQRLRGEGPPRPGGQGNGDIHYRFVIELPEKLTDDAGQGRRRARARR